MLPQLIILSTALKILFIPTYRSTDFEVHRNWLAITHNLTIDQWYYDSTSKWTLDYPPLFAWLEYGLSIFARFFDPKMLYITNLEYASDMTVLFQRLSVILLDLVYIYGVKRCTDLLNNGHLLTFILLIFNPGLLMIDHIHFQYNGFLYGFLLFSIVFMIKNCYIQSALFFAILLNLKHIYLYISPAYIVYLLRAYCITSPTVEGSYIAWRKFSILNLLKLGLTVITVFGITYGPFIKHINQILFRLFPFKRGLCHAYWAPNFWALYNLGDKILMYGLAKIGMIVTKADAAMTGGLVQEYNHAVLPSIKPSVTFMLTIITMIPALVKLWKLGADSTYRTVNFIRCVVICATCSFMFGWHVHEKAILMVLIPLTFLSALGEKDAKMFLFLSTLGHYSLFPLLYPKYLLPIKSLILLIHSTIAFSYVPLLYVNSKLKKKPKREFLCLPMLNYWESYYLYSIIGLCLYEHVIHQALGLEKSLPFLPLMLTSVYCAGGVLYFWMYYYYYFITINISNLRPNVSHKCKTK